MVLKNNKKYLAFKMPMYIVTLAAIYGMFYNIDFIFLLF